MEKGQPNVNLAEEVLFSYFFDLLELVLFLFLLCIFSFPLFDFKKGGETPLCVAVKEGYEQIVQILLEKGGANVNSPQKVFFSLFF